MALIHTMLAIGLAASASVTAAIPPADIQRDNTSAMVFLRVLDSNGAEVESGSGFIVSHDGHVITAAHIFPTKSQKLVATIGQRDGTSYTLQFRDSDARDGDTFHDTALWQLPQSAVCRSTVVLNSRPVQSAQRLIALGFPDSSGLQPAFLNVTNPQAPSGFIASDGQVEPGDSGGPAFDEAGHVVGFVQGGTLSGAHFNDLVPIAHAIALITKNGVLTGIDHSLEYPLACYSTCENPAHGIEKWTIETRWEDQTGRENGGEGEGQRCREVIARDLVGQPPGTVIELDSGENDSSKGMWEEHFDHPLDKYIYHCRGTLRSGPIYKTVRSRACPLWQ